MNTKVMQVNLAGARTGGSVGGTLGTWLMILATLSMAVIIGVEMINTLFYDPYEDDYFLFRLAGSMEDVAIGPLTYLMFGSLLVALMMGLPLTFVTGGLGVMFIYLVGDATMLNIIPGRIFPMMTNSDLAAIPLFIFMASMLERAGLIEEMFNVVYKWMGGLSGGLATATILASTILAAMVGVIGAAVVTMGIIALPAMLKRGYDHQIALGSIMAGGTLGILIPPSILAILYAVVAQQSVGELYLGSIIPGLMLSGMYIAYVLIRTKLNPKLGPPVPPQERISFGQKLLLLKDLVAPLVLVMLVLGLLFGGIATPVEAAGIGSFGAMLVAMKHGAFSVEALKDASVTTAKASAMVLWIMFGASVFVGFYILQGGQEFITQSILSTGMSAYGILFLLMILLVILGMFLDWVGILLLAVPIFIPIVQALQFEGLFGLPGVAGDDVVLWFGVLYLVNMQMSFLSPPFGYALFYIRGVCPPEITMATIFKSSLVFLALQAVGLMLCVLMPGVVTWLPNLVYG
ncbi:TRAP transporter large permease subunit [Sedimenticola hydrogenitrophicus]|uniref:TRAP transporter large permease n=1 Tax=Sedimenticola hydrogenitrophicus TaxID=2967975 RepID=UPI002FF7E9DD